MSKRSVIFLFAILLGLGTVPAGAQLPQYKVRVIIRNFTSQGAWTTAYIHEAKDVIVRSWCVAAHQTREEVFTKTPVYKVISEITREPGCNGRQIFKLAADTGFRYGYTDFPFQRTISQTATGWEWR